MFGLKRFSLSMVAASIASMSFAQQYSPPAQYQNFGQPALQTISGQPTQYNTGYSPSGVPQQVVQNYQPMQQPTFQQPTFQQPTMQQPMMQQPMMQQPGQQVFDAQQQPSQAWQSSVREVIQRALQTNPDVRARWNAFMAATEDVKVARGDLFPNLDYSAQIDRGWSKSTTHYENGGKPYDADSSSSSYTGRPWHKTPYALTLSQSIFEGFATTSLISQYGKEKVAKYLDFLATSEDTAQAAGEAYFDVLRRRKLLSLAEDYFVLHRAIFEQINQRTQQGIANRVDLDQAASRLALSDYSLTVEQGNLHDVSSRYLRVVGELPPPGIFDSAGFASSLPGSEAGAVQMAFTTSPLLRAAIERVVASGYQIDGARSAFYPKLNFQAKIQQDRDNSPSVSIGTGGANNSYQVLRNNARTVGLYASWNLFNGFSDAARVRKYEFERDSVADQRERACRDLRQNVSIAYNSVVKWREGLAVTRNQLATLTKARDAYRDQYNIGKRSLLDLLNTEKELFDARSTLVNSEADLNIGLLKLYANMGTLLQQIGMMHTPGQDGIPSAQEFEQGAADLCPPQTAVLEGTNRAELESRARALIGRSAATPAYTPPAFTPQQPQSFNLSADALFDLGSATLRSKGISEVNDLADKIKGQQISSISVTGHTDRLGSARSNQTLSQRRADAVKSQLVSRGISSSLISTSGRGQNDPVTGGKCSGMGSSSRNRALVDCLQPDRRVEVQVR